MLHKDIVCCSTDMSYEMVIDSDGPLPGCWLAAGEISPAIARRKCPWCGQRVHAADLDCPFCGGYQD